MQLDLRPGGAYRFTLRDLERSTSYYVDGEIRRVDRPERLVFTWRPGAGSPGPEGCETLVSVEFVDCGLECVVELTQEVFPSRAMRDEHLLGWEYCLEQLSAFLARAGGDPEG